MKVKRIVANIATADPSAVDGFYRDLLGLELVMDHGWIRPYASPERMTVQVSFASEGGSGTPVPDLSIEVDDLDEALRRVQAHQVPVEYGPVQEPWGRTTLLCAGPAGQARQHPPARVAVLIANSRASPELPFTVPSTVTRSHPELKRAAVAPGYRQEAVSPGSIRAAFG